MSKEIVIFFDRHNMKVSNVKVGKKVKIEEIGQSNWNAENLTVILKELAKAIGKTKARILLSDDLSYILNLEVPRDTPKAEERSYIQKKISEQIPEILENEDWDYKEITEKDGNRIVVVFAPVNAFFEKLSASLKEAGIEAEAVEPVTIARQRDNTPEIGIALKKDLKGKDEEVLNIEPIDTQETLTSLEKGKHKKPKLFTMLIISTITLILLSGVAVFLFIKTGYLSLDNFIVRKTAIDFTKDIEKPDETTFEASNTTPETELEKEFAREELRVQVLNGRGIPGIAGKAAELLEEIGYTAVETGNADTYMYEQTILYLGPSAEQFEDEIKNDLQDISYPPFVTEDLDEGNKYDVILIVTN